MSHSLSGKPSPSPIFPQDVNVVTGGNELYLVGRNLLDESTLRQGSGIDASVTNRVFFPSNYYLEPDTYTLYTNLNTTTYKYAVGIGSTPFPTASYVHDTGWQTSDHVTFTINQRGYLGVGIAKSNGTDTLTPNDISSYHFMLCKGAYDSSLSYVPYQSQSFDLNLGKNLLDNKNGNVSLNGITFTKNQNGSITINGTATADTHYYFGINNGSNIQKIDKLKTYSMSIGQNFPFNAFFRISDANSSGTFKQCQNAYGTNTNKVENIAGSFFTSGGIIAQIFVYNGQIANNWTVYPQLEESDTATSYAPPNLPIELCKIGNYQDYLYNNGGKWIKHKAIGKTTISVESVKTNYTALDYAVINRETNDIDYNTYGTHKCYCNLGISTNKDNDTPYDNIFYLWKLEGKAALTSWWFGITKNTTLADAQSMLNGGYIYYILATPIEEEITDLVTLNYLNDLKYGAESYYGTTNITITSSELQPTLKVQTLDKIGG